MLEALRNLRAQRKRALIVPVGDFVDLNLDRLIATLNALQSAITFHADTAQKQPPIEFAAYQFAGVAYDAKAITQALERRYQGPDAPAAYDYVIGVTGIWIAENGEDDGAPKSVDDYFFGYWKNEQTKGAPANVAVFSLAPWQNKYEELAFRDIYQYCVFLMASFIGDQLVEGGLTHPEFRWCVYDFNPDLDSVVRSIKKSRMCDKCRSALAGAARSDSPDHRRVVRALDGMLGYCRRPTFLNILKHFRNDAIFSIFFTGFLMSIVAGTVGQMIDGVAWLGVALAVAFFAGLVTLAIKERYFPGRTLG